MSLLAPLRSALANPAATSFQLMGEDLVLLTGPALREAADRYEADLERVPAALRTRFHEEQRAILADAHGLLRRYNRNIHARIRGYLAVGRRCRFEFPWPVVAVLGLCQVLQGTLRSRVYGLVGELAVKAGYSGLRELAAGLDDVLLRTNRGIFADSIPPVLLAFRCHALRCSGEPEVAEALLAGPLPPTMDEENRVLARSLYEAAAIDDGEARFRALSDLTLRQFGREQAVFTYQMGKTLGLSGKPLLIRKLLTLRSIPAPAIERNARGIEVVFRPFPLPAGFDMADHAGRVDAFGRAFVRAVTGSTEEYRAAVRYVIERFGRGDDFGRVAELERGGMPLAGEQA